MALFQKDNGWRDVVNQTALKSCNLHQEEITTIFVHQSQNKAKRLACMDCVAAFPASKNISIKQAIQNKQGVRLPNWPPIDESLMKEVEAQLMIHQNNRLQESVSDFWINFQQLILSKIEMAKQKTLRQIEQIQIFGEMMHQQYIQMTSTLPFIEKIEQNSNSLEKIEKEIDKYIEYTYDMSDQNNDQLRKLLQQHKDLFQSFNLQEGIELEKQTTNIFENFSFMTLSNRYKPIDVEQKQQTIYSNQASSPSHGPQSNRNYKKSSSDTRTSLISPTFHQPNGVKIIDDKFQMINSPFFESAEIFNYKNQNPSVSQQISTHEINIPQEVQSQIGCQFYSKLCLLNDKYYNIEFSFKNKIMSNSNQGFCVGLIAENFIDTLLYMNSSLFFSLIKGINNSNSLIIIGQGKSLLEFNKQEISFCLQVCINENILRIVPKQQDENTKHHKSDSNNRRQNQNEIKTQKQFNNNNSITNTCRIERNIKYRICLFTNQPGQIIKIIPYVYIK